MSIQQAEGGRADSSRRQATRARLIDAAFGVFAENGFHETTIEMIAERADFTRGAFYSNFASKEELFFTMLEQGHAEVFDQLEAGLGSLASPPLGADGSLDPDALAAFLHALLGGLPKEPVWHRLDAEFEALALRDPEIGARFLALRRRFDERLAVLIGGLAEAMGVELTVGPTEAAAVLTAFYVASMRDALIAGEAEEFVAGRGAHVRTLALVVRALVRPR